MTAPSASDPRGTLGMSEDGEWQIRFERQLEHPPERVWDSLVDPEQQAAWVPGVRFEARPGTPVLFDFGPEGKAEGEVIAAEPPRMLEHTWLWPGEPPSTVRWVLHAEGEGTLLVLLHRPLNRGTAVDYSAGWHVMLDALGIHLDGGDPGAVEPDFAGLAAEYAAATER